MLHEISPHRFDGEYKDEKPNNGDIIMSFKENEVLLIKEEDVLRLPVLSDYESMSDRVIANAKYLFAIDEKNVFLYLDQINSNPAFIWQELNVFREFPLQYEAFVGITASQLYRFYRDNKFCGRCGTIMERSKTERALCCPTCHNTVYPKISPAVIVAITDGNRLLLTKYAHGSYKKYALVAGFVEIGESFEEAVKREVKEEVGLNVKNIRYYKSSPWAFSDTMMVGFLAELDGDDTITLQESELKEATWFEREDIPTYFGDISISHNLIEYVRAGKHQINK